MKWFSLLLIAACLAGCNPSSSGPASSAGAAASVVQPDLPTQAQPKLKTIKLWLGPAELETELALTPTEIMTGMMFRTNVDDSSGMLFVFAGPSQRSFWMKNCPSPLSCAYIDPEGVILEIRELEPFNTNSVVSKTDRVQYVLETARGWYDRKNIKPGMVIRTERGTLRQTFISN